MRALTKGLLVANVLAAASILSQPTQNLVQKLDEHFNPAPLDYLCVSPYETNRLALQEDLETVAAASEAKLFPDSLTWVESKRMADKDKRELGMREFLRDYSGLVHEILDYVDQHNAVARMDGKKELSPARTIAQWMTEAIPSVKHAEGMDETTYRAFADSTQLKSKAGALGPMQIMPGTLARYNNETGRGLEVEDILTIDGALEVSIHYHEKQLKRFEGSEFWSKMGYVGSPDKTFKVFENYGGSTQALFAKPGNQTLLDQRRYTSRKQHLAYGVIIAELSREVQEVLAAIGRPDTTESYEQGLEEVPRYDRSLGDYPGVRQPVQLAERITAYNIRTVEATGDSAYVTTPKDVSGSHIARKHGMRWSQLEAVNDHEIVKPGQVWRIPSDALR